MVYVIDDKVSDQDTYEYIKSLCNRLDITTDTENGVTVVFTPCYIGEM